MAKKKKTKPAKKVAQKSKKKPAKKLVAKSKAKKVLQSKAKKTLQSKAKKVVKSKAKKAAPKKTLQSKATKSVKTAAPKKVAAKIVAKVKVAAPITPAAPVISLGTQIPALELESTEGSTVNLKEVAEQNRHVILYFYPKDDTPGCTKEACDFRDSLSNLTTFGAAVVGVSPDSKESHQNFATKHSLNFTLLTDPDHALAEQLGVWKSKQFMGNAYMGVERSTFLFTDGKLSRVWQPVKVEGHVGEVLQSIEEVQA